MSQPKNQQRHNIGIDARMFGTAQSAGIGTYTEELIGNLLQVDKVNRYTIFATPEVVQFFPFYSPNLDKKSVSIPHYSLSEQLFLPGIIRSSNIDLIHYTNFNSPVLFGGIKSVVTIHDLTLWFFPGRKHTSWFKRAVYRYIIKRSCQNATKIIAVSEATKQDIVKYLDIPESKIKVIHEAVANRISPVKEINKIDAIKAKYDITRPFFMYVGQWRKHKNLVKLIRAFATFRHRYDLDYQLVLVGRPDPLAPEVQKTINQLNLQSHVVLTGYVADNDIGAFYSAAEAFVFPSLYEGFGLPPLEAMAAGTPVISSNASVMPEVLGDAAIYFDPENIEDIAAKMHNLATSYHLKNSLKEKGLKQVKKYSFSKMAKQTYELYQEVLAKNGRDRVK